MPFLSALVLGVGVLCLIDLVLTVGVIRRLRTHEEMLAARPGVSPPIVLPPGATIGAFSAVSTDGVHVSAETLTEPALVGVFSPDCPACGDRLPQFAERARSFPGGRGSVLAVLVGTEEEVAAQRRALEPVALVLIEEYGTGVTKALRVQGFPSLALLDGHGRVLASGSTLADLDALPASA
ncbi:TlpA family protein disulfide reductase [Microbispora sp. H10949]|uniref:TlpA family protein disulfide reductase n=1 Tax=Microbispora sp. H10949 TaxID=2729111 RepID=UPI0016031C56|nr:redoxin domain-containing protein [Microbispora sp. H10949]